MKIKEARKILKNTHFEIMVPIITKNEMEEVHNAVRLAFKSLGLLEKVIDIVFSDKYPEYKEEELCELLEAYNDKKMILNGEVREIEK